MADLRITGVSNNQLELQAPDGSRHYLEITPDLLKALKSRDLTLPKNVSPREIQQLVRLGASLEQVAAKTGADPDLIARFAKPIVAELQHVVNLARGIRLSLAGDRFAEPMLVEFGTIMDERLANNGAKEITWAAKKSLDGEWLVTVSFTTSAGEGTATWAFDPKQLFLAPENEAALQLSNGVPVSAVTRTVPISQEAPKEEAVEDDLTERTVSLTVVPEIHPSAIEEPEDLFEEPTTASTLRIVEEITEEVIEVVPELNKFEEIEPQSFAEENEVNETAEEAQSEQPSAKPQATSGWAEVLFGSRDDEEENN